MLITQCALDGRNLRITLALSVAALAAASAPAAQAATVCNEASKGQRGDYVVSGGIVDPSTPARYTTALKPLGNGTGKGLERAADQSPALRQCGLPGSGGATTIVPGPQADTGAF